MKTLSGVLEFSMGNFLCLRGYIDYKTLSAISEENKDVQRELIEKHKGERESDFWRYGRIVVEGPNAVGIRSFLCDCMVRYGDGDEDGMICEMLRRAFGGGEPMVHYFKEIGLGGIRSLEELALRLAAAVPAGSRI